MPPAAPEDSPDVNEFTDRDSLLDDILAQESVEVVFQPICFVRNRAVTALEALCRGTDPRTGASIPPGLLFSLAKRKGLTLPLDRLCRQAVLKAFKPLSLAYPDLTLFMNFEASIVDEGVVGSGVLAELVRTLDLEPGRIVIEIIESRVRKTEDLQEFAETHKRSGFLFALDDIGVGHSNLQRLSHIKPDVLKVDRSLIHGIEEEYFKQEIFSALVKLAHKLGALVVAEGVETEPQALETLRLGADLLQGVHLGVPCAMGASEMADVHRRVRQLAARLKAHLMEETEGTRGEEGHFARVAREASRSLSDGDDTFDAALEALAARYPLAECLYILDPQGYQVSDTVFNPEKAPAQTRVLFHPAEAGTDHSLKEYFMTVSTGLTEHLTAPYISLASGRLCRTFAIVFRHVGRGPHVLCVDFDVQGSGL